MSRVKKEHRGHFHQHTQQEEDEGPPNATWVNALLLGIAMKLGGCTIAWNYGLVVGFWEYFMAVVVIGCGYAMLGLCMSEMISIMSFSGGYYGYARCAIGPFPGYIVGCCGIMESVFSMSMSVLKIGQFFTLVFELDRQYEILWWFLTFGFVICSHAIGAQYFWQWIAFVALSCLTLVFIYLFGSMPVLDFEKYAQPHADFTNDPAEFFTVFRLAVLFFLGFDMLTMTSSEVKNPKIGIPRAMLTLIGFLFVLAIWLMFTVSCQPPGITEELYVKYTLFPLMFGYERIFGLSRRMALCLCVIPSFSAVLGYMYVVSRQVTSMAKSGLLPAIFKYTFGPNHTPIYGMLFVSSFGILGLTYSWAENPYTTTSRFSTLAGCVIYLAMFVCYIIFNTRFSNLERSFRNPFGMFSAILGIIIFGAVFVIMIVLNTEFYPVTAMFFGYIGLMTLYYYAYAETHQFFSASEQKVFFKAYIVNMKRRKDKNFLTRMWTDFLKLLACCSKTALMKVRVYASETSDSRVASDSRGSGLYSSDQHSESHQSGGDSRNYENESEGPASILSNNLPLAELPDINNVLKAENKTVTSFTINFHSLRQSSSLKLTGILNGSNRVSRTPTNNNNATNSTTIPVMRNNSSSGSGKENNNNQQFEPAVSPTYSSKSRKTTSRYVVPTAPAAIATDPGTEDSKDIECGGGGYNNTSSKKVTMNMTIHDTLSMTPPAVEEVRHTENETETTNFVPNANKKQRTDEEILEQHEEEYAFPTTDEEGRRMLVMQDDDQVSMMHLPCDDFNSSIDHEHEHEHEHV